MSEYSEIKIGSYSLWAFKDCLEKKVLELFFNPADLTVEKNEGSKPGCCSMKYTYRTTVKRACDRLDVLGYSIQRAESLFCSRAEELLEYHNYLNQLKIPFKLMEQEVSKRIKKYVTFKKYLNALKKCILAEMDAGINMWFIDNFEPKTELDKVIYYASKDNYYSSFYGLTDLEYVPFVFRMILSFFDSSKTLECDFSNIIGWTYNSVDEARLDGIEDKIIVLVEGTSDKEILEYSLAHLYPHLSDIFYFMDFEYSSSFKKQGGIDSIGHNLKAFILSKLKARFLAVFDNDAVGYFAKEKLSIEIKHIPENIRIMNYPSLSFFKKYPTISPKGQTVLDDINSRACSIELYLPDEMIKSKAGKYHAIEWESLIKGKVGNKTKQIYQGVITNKDEIKKRFFEHKNKKQFEPEKWGRMKALLESFIFSFR